MRTDDPKIIYLKDYAPSPYRIDHVDMKAEIGAAETRVTTQLTISPLPGTPADTPLVLDGAELKLETIALDGAPVTEDFYEATPDGLILFSPPTSQFVLETEVSIYPHKNTELMGLYLSNGVWCTQCEPEGFRRITYYLDRPDMLAPFKVTMIADKNAAPVLLANGNPLDSGDMSEGRHYAVWDDPHPKPSYLFAMVAGDLGSITDSFITRSGKHVDLAIYCEHGKEGQCGYAMDSLIRSMAWDEKRFGREYDLDVFNIVAVSDFNFGAMENKGLNIFNDRYVLANPETATDADYANVERVIAHEYFHNWTGNRITCRDWFQLCLKEGLTVYRDQEFTSDERSRPVKRIEDVRGLRAAQFPEDAGPLAHPPRPDNYREIENFYTPTVYEKGAEVVRMLATLLGPEDFRKGTDLYFERHDGEATTIEAWLKVFEDATGRDLGQFGKWYTQAGTPEVTVTESWDERTKTYGLHFRQHVAPTPGQPDKDPLVLPIKFGLVGPNGQDMDWESADGAEISGDMIVIDGAETMVTFTGLAGKPVPSLFRGFSAPVKLEMQASQQDSLFLARHDSDPFNRWQALQDAAMAVMVEAVQAGGKLADAEAVRALGNALADTLANADLDNALKANALSLPGETAIAQKLGENIDPALIHAVRRKLTAEIAVGMAPALASAYDDLGRICVPYSIEAASTRARALRNQCLALLAAAGDQADARLQSHYGDADNMTDRMAALGAAVATDADCTTELLTDFRNRFGADPLVFDKWLALNASRTDDGCLDNVRAIYDAADFPRHNPNRLRSLVGMFAKGNPVQFARADGEGFRFVAQICAEVDKDNPQVAAGILTAFRLWGTYELARRKIAGSVLEELAERRDLSRNLDDILIRILEK